MRWSERAVVLGVLAVLSGGPSPAAAQTQDTLRPPPTAAELHAQRRAWLEARRSGAVPAGPVRYGSAVVGVAPGADAAGVMPGPGGVHSGGVPVVCQGWVSDGGGPMRGPVGGDVSFRGDCRLLGHGPGGYPGGPWLPGGPPPSQRYWNGWGWTPAYPFGWGTGAGGAYQFPWPGLPADECVLLYIATAGAPAIELPIGLRSLGLADARDLDLAIEAKLARGEAVDLYGLDGRWVRLPAGTLLDDVRVRRCDAR